MSTFKAETYRFLRLPRPAPEELEAGAAFAPGTVHLPGWADTEWIKQLTAEQLVTVRNRHDTAPVPSHQTTKLRAWSTARPCQAQVG